MDSKYGSPMLKDGALGGQAYTIEATGLDGWMSYRYQYKAGVHDFFGYAETQEEARAIIEKAQVSA